MAKIILNVELGQEKVLNDLKTLKSGIENIASSLGNVKVNKDLTAQLNALTKNYNALSKAAQTAQKVNNKQEISTQKLAKATAQATTAKINEQKASVQLETAQIKLTKAQQQGVKTVKEATQTNEKHKQSILSMAAGFFQWQMAAMFVMKPLNAIREAWASINETLVKTEDAVVSLQRVLNDDSLSNETISGKLYDLAAKYGQTFENANSIAQNFARTGMNWNETIKATEAALLALNVAELDATQASDGLIAIMQQFGYEASNLTGIIDILNKTADNYAVTTDKLLTALQRTGSSAKNANLSLQETVGIVTALSEATGRSGENLGTAVNSLIQFSTKTSALDTFSKLSDNMATLVDDFRHGKGTVLDIWQGLSTEIKNANGSNESILSGLFGDDDWRSLNEELQEALGENFAKVTEIYDTASTFRKNYFIALLNNMDTVEKAIGTASDAAGYSQKENEKYLETYTAKVNTLKAKWEEIANDEQGLLGIKKTLVEVANWLLDILKGIGGIKGAIQTAIAVASPFLTKWAIVFGVKAISSLKSNLVSLFNAIKAGAISANAALGLIGVALGTIVIAINAVKRANEEAAKKRQEIIENYEANKKTAQSLQELYDKYKTLTDKDNDYNSVQKKIVEILKEKYDVLKNLKEGTDEYTQTIKNLTEAELKRYNVDRQNAAKAAKENLVNYNIGGYSQWGIFETLGKSSLSKQDSDILNSLGVQTEHVGDKTRSQYRLSGLKGASKLEQYKVFNVAFDALYDAYEKALIEGNTDRANQIKNSSAWSDFSSAISDSKGYVDKYFETTVDELLSEYRIANGGITNESDYNKMVSSILKQVGADSYYDDTIKNLIGSLESYIGKQESVVDKTKTWEEQSKGVLTNYKDLLDTISKLREEQQNLLDIEEKKKALEDARNNRNVRVYNAATGEWELQADEKAIADAEKAYEDAVWKSVESSVKDQTIKVGEILDKIEDFPELTKAVAEWLKGEGYNVPDNLLYGTSSTVLSPTSGMTSNVSNSSQDNRTYTINGVPITQEQAQKYTVVEAFEMAADMTN